MLQQGHHRRIGLAEVLHNSDLALEQELKVLHSSGLVWQLDHRKIVEEHHNSDLVFVQVRRRIDLVVVQSYPDRMRLQRLQRIVEELRSFGWALELVLKVLHRTDLA